MASAEAQGSKHTENCGTINKGPLQTLGLVGRRYQENHKSLIAILGRLRSLNTVKGTSDRRQIRVYSRKTFAALGPIVIASVAPIWYYIHLVPWPRHKIRVRCGGRWQQDERSKSTASCLHWLYGVTWCRSSADKSVQRWCISVEGKN
jgi:hypothetical protein